MFKCEIATDNAAFEDDAAAEVAAILRRLADKVEEWGYGSSPILDSNGNTVGEWTLRTDEI